MKIIFIVNEAQHYHNVNKDIPQLLEYQFIKL